MGSRRASRSEVGETVHLGKFTGRRLAAKKIIETEKMPLTILHRMIELRNSNDS
jgi:hypothetical protein